MMRSSMTANARATGVLAAVLALATPACSSSPNGPPRDAGDARVGNDDADDFEAGPETGDAAPETTDARTLLDGGPRCPASYAARAEGETCFGVVIGCDYPEGRCGCLVCEVDAQHFGYVWSCRRWDSGGAGCPARSPPLGSTCDGPGEQCRYGAYCSVSVGDDLECDNGSWQPAPPVDACGYRLCPG